MYAKKVQYPSLLSANQKPSFRDNMHNCSHSPIILLLVLGVSLGRNIGRFPMIFTPTITHRTSTNVTKMRFFSQGSNLRRNGYQCFSTSRLCIGFQTASKSRTELVKFRLLFIPNAEDLLIVDVLRADVDAKLVGTQDSFVFGQSMPESVNTP